MCVAAMGFAQYWKDRRKTWLIDEFSKNVPGLTRLPPLPRTQPRVKANKSLPSTNVDYISCMATATFCVLLQSRISVLFPDCHFQAFSGVFAVAPEITSAAIRMSGQPVCCLG